MSFSVQSVKNHLMTLAKPPLQGNMFLEFSSQKLGEPLSLHPTNERCGTKIKGLLPLSFWALNVVKLTTMAWRLGSEALS